jgi:hypothetical protein
MRLLRVRAIQLVLLAALVIGLPPAPAQSSEAGCYAICLYNDWACIFQTWHPAEACGYDAQSDICYLGGCWLN